jgi:GNAT superfamily N-acetyltransferase
MKKNDIMIECIRTDSDHSDFRKLVRELDADLSIRDGADHAFYHQFNKIDKIKYAIVAYEGAIPIGCGAIKEYSPEAMEVKRMYVIPEKRGRGFASFILQQLEHWSAELRYSKCLLETGKKQPEAIQLYQKNNYKVIPNYGQYQGVENSLCFEKLL